MANKELYANAPSVLKHFADSDYEDDDSDYEDDDYKQDMADEDEYQTPTRSTERFTSEGFDNPTKARKTRTRSTDIHFRAYVYKVLKQVHSDTGISKKALNQVSNLAMYIFEIIVEEANRVLRMSSKSTLTSDDIQTAMKLTVPSSLTRLGVSEGTKSVSSYKEAMDPARNRSGDRKGRLAKSALAGLQFPVSRIARMIKAYLNGPRVSVSAPIYLAAVMELITAEVLDHAGNMAKDARRQRITPRDIFLGVTQDTDLDLLFKNLVILNGGTHMYIQPALLPKRNEKGRLIKKKAQTSKKTSPKKTKKSPKKETFLGEPYRGFYAQ